MRPKGSTIAIQSKVAEEVTKLLNTTTKSQFQITQEIGLTRSNILTMIKQGRTKLPIRLVVPLAKACEGNPSELMMTVLEEYHPEILNGLGEAFGLATTSEEQTIVGTFRRAKAAKEKRKQAGARSHASTVSEERQAALIRATVNTDHEVLKRLYDFFYGEMLT